MDEVFKMTARKQPRLPLNPPHLLRDKAEYDLAVTEIDDLLERNPVVGSAAHDRLDILTILVETYDEEHYAMGTASTPQDVVDFMLDQRGMTRADLADVLGGRSRVSEFFAGKRRLSITQIEKLRELFRIPADLLLGPGAPEYVSTR